MTKNMDQSNMEKYHYGMKWPMVVKRLKLSGRQNLGTPLFDGSIRGLADLLLRALFFRSFAYNSFGFFFFYLLIQSKVLKFGWLMNSVNISTMQFRF